MLKINVILVFLSISSINCWEALPQIPTGRRSQFLVLHENGAYKYGYDTGDGSSAVQSGDAANEVEGRYLYDSPSGGKVSLKYTAGVQGFVAESATAVSPSIIPVPATPVISQYINSQENVDDQSNTADASYSFTIDDDSYKRQETSNARGNIQGSYSYTNQAGTHDLSYTSGENIGFVAVSGSLATPNGLPGGSQATLSRIHSNGNINSLLPPSSSIISNGDGTYSFQYSTNDAAQQQSGDNNGNVKGSYSYRNSAGTHDLSYVAGSDTGFLVTGGSLSQPNGLGTQTAYATPIASKSSGADAISSYSLAPEDGSYSFEYSTDDSSRRETSDTNGNVQGSYFYRNQAGNHDLNYIAGSSTGFQVTGGSLSVPNGLGDNTVLAKIYPIPQTTPSTLSSQDDLANTGDSSYSFNIDTDDYKRTETSDASGNVQGSFSYKNSAGVHDLSFVAGSTTGFLPTGGNLAQINTALASSNDISRSSPAVSSIVSSIDSEQNTGDASYNFSFDTDDYKRIESSDTSGNVVGSYWYKNSAGEHDLSYEAGADKGFKTTGGSLSIPPGLTEAQLGSGSISNDITYSRAIISSPPSVASLNPSLLPSKTSYKIGNVVVNSYLPPSNKKRKFGYIFDTEF